MYKEALEVARSLEFRRADFLEISRTNKDVFKFFCTLHSCFMAAALNLVSQFNNTESKPCNYSIELALASMKFFQFNKAEQLEIAKKIVKKSKLYLHFVSGHDNKHVLQFYDVVSQVLQVMHPSFCQDDFLLFLVFKMEQLKNLDYSVGPTILLPLKKFFNLFEILCDFSPNIKKNIASLFNFFFVKPPDNCANVSEIINSCLNQKDQKQELLFLIISIIFHHGIQHWWKIFNDDWATKLSSKIFKDLITAVLNLTKEFHRLV